MEFKVNNKEYALKFGIKFIRQLDEVYKVDYQGLEFGMGVNLAYINLVQKNPTVLVEVIKAGISHHTNTPKQSTIELAIEEYAEIHDGLSTLFTELLDELGKSVMVKDTLKDFQEKAVKNK
ncbi:tail assembly chaperone [Oceanobacillus sp. 1P07AA]|uniref:tail assembly chaperone n=1 Tax=Oceanobacillus sp. 1P07AA TaxID=3132293 RepID=UPI0039A4E932